MITNPQFKLLKRGHKLCHLVRGVLTTVTITSITQDSNGWSIGVKYPNGTTRYYSKNHIKDHFNLSRANLSR